MKPFQFKQFSVNQERCAMKIGTDAVLLGAWTSLKNNLFSALDIGAGTGVLALILAQRSTIETIDALEIDTCLLYTSPSPRDRQKSRMPSSA